MKDRVLRASILITASSYAKRGDHDGELISRVLESIIRCAETLDEAGAVDADKDGED